LVKFDGEKLHVPGMPEYNPMQLLHGEQDIKCFKPLQKDKRYVVKEKIIDVADKGKGAVLVT